MTSNSYAFVGGGRDGGEVRAEGSVPPGAEFRFALAHDAARCEVYVLGEDGRLRFDRYAPTAFTSSCDPDFREALRPIIAHLGAALAELESAYARRGLPPPVLQVNDWLVRRA